MKVDKVLSIFIVGSWLWIALYFGSCQLSAMLQYKYSDSLTYKITSYLSGYNCIK